jgi:hypothetical protein
LGFFFGFVAGFGGGRRSGVSRPRDPREKATTAALSSEPA